MDKKPAPEGSLEAVNGSNAAVNGQQMMQAQPNAMAQPQLAAPQAGAPYYPPNVMSQHYPMMPGGAVPHGPPAQPPVWNQAAPPTYYNPYHQVAPAAHVPLVSIISPDDTKKIRKMQGVNLACSLLQLACAITIICVVGRELALYNFITVGRGTYVDYYCFAATPAWQGTCEYAYALAATSIFFCFVISLMQCLTMDCCGAGRGMEAVFDSVMFVWWTAGTVVLAVRADEANKAGLPKRDARNAVVAMAAISAFMFLALLVANIVLIKRLGKAYKAASQQVQQRMTAYLPAGTPMTAYPQQTPGAVAPAPGGPTATTDAKNVDNAV